VLLINISANRKILLKSGTHHSQTVMGKAKKRQTLIEDIVSIMRLKSVSLKVTLTIGLTMSLVGALTFSSLVTMILIQNFTAMMTSFIQVVMGVALVGRMVPSSMLLDIALIG